MTESEWLNSHPAQNEEIVKAWEKKEAREEIRTGLIRLTLAQVMVGKKKSGGYFKLEDFIPSWCIQKPKKSNKPIDPENIVKMFADIMETPKE